MHVILTTDVPDLGSAGDTVEVKRGYGNNYLIPTGRAVLASTSNARQLQHERRKIEARIARERSEAEATAKQLAGLSVTLTRLVGEGDKIFGSVTSRDIADALSNALQNAPGGGKFTVDSRQVRLEAPLKALGVYEVDIKLHREVTAQIKVWVVAD